MLKHVVLNCKNLKKKTSLKVGSAVFSFVKRMLRVDWLWRLSHVIGTGRELRLAIQKKIIQLVVKWDIIAILAIRLSRGKFFG